MLTKEQKLARRSGIGGSDAAAILGLSTFATPLDIFLEKTSKEEPADDEMTEAQYWGHIHEENVAQEWAKRMTAEGRRVVVQPAATSMTHPEHEFIRGNIDRWAIVDGAREGLEVKTANEFVKHLWGDEESDKLPDYYLIQVLHYMLVTGLQRWHVAVLIGGNKFRKYVVERDEQLIAHLLDAELRFWNEHVLAGVPPAAINLEDVKRLYSRDNGTPIIAPAEIVEAVECLAVAKARFADAKEEIERHELKVKSFMGESAQLLLAPDGKRLATWKNNRDGKFFNEKRFKEDHPGLYEQYVEGKQGARVFRLAA